MINSAKVVDGVLVCMRQNHNEPVKMILQNQCIPLYDRLRCYKCFEDEGKFPTCISLKEAQLLIQDQLYSQDFESQDKRDNILKCLDEFMSGMSNLRTKILQKFDQILNVAQTWNTQIKKFSKQPNIEDFIQDLELIQTFNSINNNKDVKTNELGYSYFNKINSALQELMCNEDYIKCQNMLNEIVEVKKEKEVVTNDKQIAELKVDSIQLISTVQQDEWSGAIAFNNEGSIMVTGCGKDIKMWSFQKGKIVEVLKLKGHTDYVLSLVFSKKFNWFASGSCDHTIRCWKEYEDSNWKSLESQNSHTNEVQCLILTDLEDQLISCSLDFLIKVWYVDCQKNKFEYGYSLKSHTNSIYSMSLNTSQMALVSCDQDGRIILWGRGKYLTKWAYQHEVKMETVGYRICYLDEYQIIWQQCNQGIIQRIECKNWQLFKNDSGVELNQKETDNGLFHSIMNKNKQVIIQKHNQFVYILKYHLNGQISLESTVTCKNFYHYGALTEDGNFLVIWNSNEFSIYKIKYS